MNPRYTVEGDLEVLYQENKIVCMYTIIPGTGWVILWSDDQGYTVSSVTGNNRSNGRALSIHDARDEFRDAVEHMLHGRGPRQRT